MGHLRKASRASERRWTLACAVASRPKQDKALAILDVQRRGTSPTQGESNTTSDTR